MYKDVTGFLSSEIKQLPPQKCLFHIISAGYEQSVSYGQGTSLGPQAILAASQQLELWDGESCPGNAGIYTYPPLDCTGNVSQVLERIFQSTCEVLKYDKLPVLLGGEHTVSLGVIKALKTKYSDFGIVQFDAHADLRDTYDDNSYSHACVMRRAVEENIPLIQIGVRALCLEEVETRKKFNICHHDAASLYLQGFPNQLIFDDFPKKIYLSFDVDALDSSLLPATGTPVPGGLLWYDTLKLLSQIITKRQIIGFDMVEFAPLPNLLAYDFLVAKLVYQIMGIVERNQKS